MNTECAACDDLLGAIHAPAGKWAGQIISFKRHLTTLLSMSIRKSRFLVNRRNYIGRASYVFTSLATPTFCCCCYFPIVYAFYYKFFFCLIKEAY